MAGECLDGNFSVRSLDVFPDPGTQDDGAHKGRPAAHGVNHRGTGEIVEAKGGKPAVGTPGPVSGNGIDKGGNKTGVDQVGLELGPFRHGPRNNGGRGGGEDHLEKPVFVHVRVFQGQFHAAKEELIRPDKAAQGVFPVHETPAQSPIHNGPEAEVHHVFHGDVGGVFCPGQAGLHQGKAGLHDEHQDGAYEEPHHVQGKSQTFNTFLGEKGNAPRAQKKYCQNEQFFSHLLNLLR